MEISSVDNSLKTSSTQGAFDNLLGVVAGNQFFDKEALQNVQAEQLQEAFFDWADSDFLGNDGNQKTNSLADLF